MILCLCFFLLLSCATTTTPPPTRATVAYATSRACVSVADCVQDQWCRSGQLCLRGLCHTLRGYPCRAGDFCLEREKRCVSDKQCNTSVDCDDGLFCNGLEQCVASRCQNNNTSPCPATSPCSEQNRSCGAPLTTQQQQKTIGIAVTLSPTEAPTEAPTTDSGTLNIQQLWTILFIAGCSLVGIGLVFYILTGAARPAVPASVVVITTKDENGDDKDPRDLLSTSAYQQTLHYS